MNWVWSCLSMLCQVSNETTWLGLLRHSIMSLDGLVHPLKIAWVYLTCPHSHQSIYWHTGQATVTTSTWVPPMLIGPTLSPVPPFTHSRHPMTLLCPVTPGESLQLDDQSPGSDTDLTINHQPYPSITDWCTQAPIPVPAFGASTHSLIKTSTIISLYSNHPCW